MCGDVLMTDEDELCRRCIGTLPRTEHHIKRENRLEQLFAKDDKLVRGGAFCYYKRDTPFSNAIHEMKYGGRPEIGLQLGKMVAEEWLGSTFFDDIDYLVPLPLHPHRLRVRGYNQAEWIARGVAEKTGIALDTKHLVRVVNNAQQAFMSDEERLALKDIFALCDAEDFRGKHVLLIDDVVTTGSTMQRAMAVFHPVRQCRYSVLSLAIASR